MGCRQAAAQVARGELEHETQVESTPAGLRHIITKPRDHWTMEWIALLVPALANASG
jgi:hypothetical protein